MENKERDEMSSRNRGFVRMRSIMDLGMGVLWAGMGVFLLFIENFDTGLEARFNDPVMKLFGGICLLYGAFRIYRGYKKNYFRS